MRRTLVLSIAAFAWASSLAHAADEYPARAVRIVVPFAPGGGTDVVGRILLSSSTLRLKQSFVIDNRPAGSGIIGADLVAKAQADGYTLLFAFLVAFEQREADQPPAVRPDRRFCAGRSGDEPRRCCCSCIPRFPPRI